MFFRILVVFGWLSSRTSKAPRLDVPKPCTTTECLRTACVAPFVPGAFYEGQRRLKLQPTISGFGFEIVFGPHACYIRWHCIWQIKIPSSRKFIQCLVVIRLFVSFNSYSIADMSSLARVRDWHCNTTSTTMWHSWLRHRTASQGRPRGRHGS